MYTISSRKTHFHVLADIIISDAANKSSIYKSNYHLTKRYLFFTDQCELIHEEK